MTLGCSKCDGYLQFYEELHFKYYNSTDLLLCWTDCCETVVVENLWKRPLGYSRAMIQKNENWWLNESNVCQRVRRFCYVLCNGGWSLMCFVIIFFDHLTNRWLMNSIAYFYRVFPKIIYLLLLCHVIDLLLPIFLIQINDWGIEVLVPFKSKSLIWIQKKCTVSL